MTALAPGMRVKCVYDGPWDSEWNSMKEGPSLGSIWTIARIEFHFGFDWLTLREWPIEGHSFNSIGFVPLDGNEDLTELENALKNPKEHAPEPERELVEIGQ